MRHRKTKQRSGDTVELNLAAMLDMAFQLLTFFILTFRPAPVEGEISLRMPQASPKGTVSEARENPIGSVPGVDPLARFDTLTISVLPDRAGGIERLAVEDTPIAIESLESRLHAILSSPHSTLRQLVIQAGAGLRYDALMNVVDKCSRQKLASGDSLKKLSFVELPDGA